MAAEQVGAGREPAIPLRAPRHPAGSSRFRFVATALVGALVIALGGAALAKLLAIRFETASFVVAVATLGTIALRLGAFVDRLERKTLEDPATCVGNRRYWESSLVTEVDRAIRSRMPLSVLMVDVDHLKSLNDAQGHVCGDRALALVGEVLRDTCRSRDVAARFGGDEFAVLLPRTRISEAKIVAERIRSELARRRVELGAPLASLLTVSIGVADLDGLAEPLPRLLFESADRALYVAKSAGRDRIELREAPCFSGVIRLDEHRAARKGRESA
jgi:diguanylate cyclase (GGDEF)-like protein